MSLLEAIFFATNAWVPLFCFIFCWLFFCLGNGGFINCIYIMVTKKEFMKPKRLFIAALWECFTQLNFLLTVIFFSKFVNAI